MPCSTKFVSTTLCLFCVVAGILQTHAQAVPTATGAAPYEGFTLPNIGGSLRYALTASESVVFGYNGQPGTGASAYTNLSGSLAYLSRSERHPFSAVYTGGYLIANSSEPSYFFQDLALSQVYSTRFWDFTIADAVDYSPQTPTTGLSGIPGVGDLGLAPVQVGPGGGIGILTQYGSRVNNIVSGTALRRLTGSTSVSGTGSYVIQRYTGDQTQGLGNDQVSGSGGVQHRIDSRSSVGAAYSYSQSNFTVGGTNLAYQTQSLTGDYSRQLTRQFSMDVSAGPQRVSNSGGLLLTAPSTNVGANASLTYTGQVYSSALSYSRGVNNGGGVVVGSRSDVINLSAQRRLGRLWHVAGLVGYNRSTQLPNSTFPSFSSSGVVASGQVSWQVRQALSAFSSYTLQRQTFDGGTPALNAFNGLSQVASFGVSYSPKPFFQRK